MPDTTLNFYNDTTATLTTAATPPKPTEPRPTETSDQKWAGVLSQTQRSFDTSVLQRLPDAIRSQFDGDLSDIGTPRPKSQRKDGLTQAGTVAGHAEQVAITKNVRELQATFVSIFGVGATPGDFVARVHDAVDAASDVQAPASTTILPYFASIRLNRVILPTFKKVFGRDPTAGELVNWASLPYATQATFESQMRAMKGQLSACPAGADCGPSPERIAQAKADLAAAQKAWDDKAKKMVEDWKREQAAIAAANKQKRDAELKAAAEKHSQEEADAKKKADAEAKAAFEKRVSMYATMKPEEMKSTYMQFKAAGDSDGLAALLEAAKRQGINLLDLITDHPFAASGAGLAVVALGIGAFLWLRK